MTPNAQFQKICESILEFHSGIRFAGIIDKMGKLVAGGMREGLRSMEHDSAELYLEFALRSEMRKDFDKEFGKTVYSYSVRENVKLASFPLWQSHVLRISMERNVPHNEIINATLKIISSSTK
ncbi:MAG: hypothetical protein EHM34_07580 [Nitrosopumilales archaeon]|nr:MAG: hypothetical protein EHM34_07580 [Nitrosopumilales archaeon]